MGDLDVYPVPREVGKVGNDDKKFILPVSSRKDGIAAAFGRVKKPEKDVNSESHAPLTEEVEAVDMKDKRKREEEDEELARKLQEEEDEKVKRPKTDEKDNKLDLEEGLEESKLKIKQDDEYAKRLQTEEEENVDSKEEQKYRQPSSKFSPEPFNPPVSPPRPQGGYGRSTQATSPRKSARPTSKRLEEAARGTKDIRNFFGSQQ